MRNRWTLEKLKSLFALICEMRTKYTMTNIPKDMLVAEAQKNSMFAGHSPNGIIRAAQRLSNAYASVQWPSDSPVMMDKYYRAIGVDTDIMPGSASLNVPLQLSASEMKCAHRVAGETVSLTGLRFKEGACYDSGTRTKAFFSSMVNVLNGEMQDLAPDVRVDVANYIQKTQSELA